MTIKFPNPSRSFDESKRSVHFWGYDQTMEVSFYVEAEALKKLSPEMDNAEPGFLKAFDDARDKIYKAAAKTYAKSKTHAYSYILTAENV